MKILVCGEIDDSKISELSGKTITAALKLANTVDLLFVGDNIPENGEGYKGVLQILYAQHANYAHGNAENIASLLMTLSNDYDAILAPSTSFYKNILPRLCALLDVMMLSDVIDIIDAQTYKRPIYAGNAIATLKNTEKKKIMTIRTTAFETAQTLSGLPTKVISHVPSLDYASKFVRQELSVSERPQLSSAKIVVSGGRGVGSQKNFEIIQNLADQLGAAVGASRAAVDAGFVPNDYQVGQTGKVVAPHLYLAVGISGAIQHLAGMKDSKIIAAINKDPEAPIFSVADIGLVADLFVAVPELQEKIKK